MSNYDDPERRYSCLSEPTQVLRRHPHSLSLSLSEISARDPLTPSLKIDTGDGAGYVIVVMNCLC